MLTHPTLDLLSDLGLHGMAKGFRDLADNPEGAALGHAEWLGILLERESTLRQQKRFESRAKAAKLRHPVGVLSAGAAVVCSVRPGPRRRPVCPGAEAAGLGRPGSVQCPEPWTIGDRSRWLLNSSATCWRSSKTATGVNSIRSFCPPPGAHSIPWKLFNADWHTPGQNYR